MVGEAQWALEEVTRELLPRVLWSADPEIVLEHGLRRIAQAGTLVIKSYWYFSIWHERSPAPKSTRR
jgi:hypothetical protein